MYTSSNVMLTTWIKKSGGNADDENFYASSVREMLTARDEDAYQASSMTCPSAGIGRLSVSQQRTPCAT